MIEATPRQVDTQPTQREIEDEFFGGVTSMMPQAEVESLSSDRAQLVDSIVNFALSEADRDDKSPVASMLKLFVARNYKYNPRGERYVQHPGNKGTLAIDGNGDLVSLVGARFIRSETNQAGSQPYVVDTIADYDYSEAVTGPKKGQHLSMTEYPIPIDWEDSLLRATAHNSEANS